MASPIDISLVDIFTRVFIAILVFVLIYGALKKVNVFGGEEEKFNSIYALIAFFLAVLTTVYGSSYVMIKSITPWFAVFFIFLILAMIPFMILGSTENDITTYIKEHTVGSWVFAVIVFIVIIGIVNVNDDARRNEILLENESISDSNGTDTSEREDFWSRTKDIITNKKVLGMVLFLLIAAYTVRNLSGIPIKK